MVSCVVTKCHNTSAKATKNNGGITFHRFPRDNVRRQQWELAINRENWSSTSASCVCSEHFEVSCFYLTQTGLRRLSADAIPSINISVCQEPAPTIAEEEPIDISPDDTPEVIKLKHQVKRLETISENRKRRLNLMWQSKRRLKKKLERMKFFMNQILKFKQHKKSVDQGCVNCHCLCLKTIK